jgi:subtilisin family serine protease
MAADEGKDQIVVATDHLSLVGSELGSRGFSVTDENGPLGLTLITLADTAGSGRMLTERRTAEVGDTASTVYSELDRVLAELRSLSAHRYGGWIPTLGKNRTLTGVEFKPYTHGSGRPTPVPAAPLPAPDKVLRRVDVGLFDTCLAPHRELTGAYLADAAALVEPPAEGRDRLWWEGHATFIAGIIRRHAPSAALDVRTALRHVPGGSGEWEMPLWRFAELLAAYQDAGVAVLNLSVGVVTEDGEPPLVLERAIAQLTPSMVVVAAAGNHGEPKPGVAGRPAPNAALYPAALDNVLAVGALDAARQGAASFNPRGAGHADTAPWIDVFAPGEQIVSTYLGDGTPERVLVENGDGSREPDRFSGWAQWTGTSFATGEITGAVANRLAQGDSPADAVAKIRAAYPRP